ncbi:hypothetical protein [Rhodococcus rhodochrous]|uniref:Uncharacterized protein n=1 Tax=Rhodococcus rhodochrous TaxID=1829 RepID=A0AA46X1B2_RHORH|nr:hypothetical protein [Rhodococcus rhodochrous]UZF48268.1 hypothetical protein KUM34_028390 [Rhodococcus rhodochrous]
MNGGRGPLITNTSQGFAVSHADYPEIDREIQRTIYRGRRRVQRAPHHGADWLVLDGTDSGYKVGQVVYVYDGDFLHPPYVIATAPIPFPDTSGRYAQWYRYAHDHEAIAWDALSESLRTRLDERLSLEDWGFEASFDDADGIGEALLGLWPESSTSDETPLIAEAMRTVLADDTAAVKLQPRRAGARR